MYDNTRHPSHLVHNHLQPDSMMLIQRVACNLDKLLTIHKYMPELDALGSHMFELKNIQPYLGDIQRISHEMNAIVSMNYNLPVIKEIEPRIKHFTQILQRIEDKLENFELNKEQILADMRGNLKLLEDLYIQYEQGLGCLLAQYKSELCAVHNEHKSELLTMVQEVQELHRQIKVSMPTIDRAVREQNNTEKVLAHLQATDAVTLAQFDKTEQSIKHATKLIRASEKQGNDETINRNRLNQKQATQSVAQLLRGK